MKDTRILMGMPVTVEVVDNHVTCTDIDKVYDYFHSIDERFSTYKETSEISQINAGTLPLEQSSEEMRHVLQQCEQTRQETGGYFDIQHKGLLDSSGYVKGWAIQNAATLLEDWGFTNFYVEVGGDLQVAGHNANGTPWNIGIRNPFQRSEIIKRVELTDMGMATSGTYIRGQHIYNPHTPAEPIMDIVSLTVIGPSIVDADRYATAAFAMGSNGIGYISTLDGFEGYSIDAKGIATFTNGFSKYVRP